MVRQSQHVAIVPRETTDGGRHETVRLRFARADEYDTALVDIEAWQYRPLQPGEAACSTWLVCEKSGKRIGWWWLQHFAPGRAELHMCAKPGERILTRHTIRGFRWVAELFGVKCLYAGPPKGDVAIEYLRRMAWAGWCEVRPGVFCLEV